MSFQRGPTYNSVSEVKGPSGFYKIVTSMGPIVVYIDQDYDGGGWVLALSNREYTGGMNNLKYDDAINNYNYRTGGSGQNSSNIVVTSDRAPNLIRTVMMMVLVEQLMVESLSRHSTVFTLD